MPFCRRLRTYTYEAEILTAGIMMYFPFEFMFPGTDCNIENGLSGGWVRKIHHEPPRIALRFSRLDTTSTSQHPIVGTGNIDTNLLFLCFCQIELVKEAKSGG